MSKTNKIGLLAGIVVVILGFLVFYYVFFSPQRLYFNIDKDPPEFAQDKSVCAAGGIELLSYTSRYADVSDASGKLTVKYQGKQSTCTVAANATGDSACKLGLKTEPISCMRVFVNSSGGCLIKAKAGEC